MGLFGFDGTTVPQGTKHVGGWMLKVTIDAAGRENAWEDSATSVNDIYHKVLNAT